MSGPLVIKVGGSLLDWPPLPIRLGAYLRSRQAERPVVIVGGGRAADLVRELDTTHGLGDIVSHDLALRALDLTAHVLAALVPGLDVVEDVKAFADVWRSGRIPLLAPRRFLDEDDRRAADPLPKSWDVTTDSIAARVAVRLAAGELVLLKSTSLPPGCDRHEAARRGLVDLTFPELSKTVECVTYVNLRHSETIAVPLPPRLDGPDVPAAESGRVPSGSPGFPSSQVSTDVSARARPSRPS